MAFTADDGRWGRQRRDIPTSLKFLAVAAILPAIPMVVWLGAQLVMQVRHVIYSLGA